MNLIKKVNPLKRHEGKSNDMALIQCTKKLLHGVFAHNVNFLFEPLIFIAHIDLQRENAF